jgi:hypothetical protein
LRNAKIIAKSSFLRVEILAQKASAISGFGIEIMRSGYDKDNFFQKIAKRGRQGRQHVDGHPRFE